MGAPIPLHGASGDFFAERRGASIIKHGVLGRYVPVFIGKTGSTSRDHRVWILDGYAGAGVYDDGALGSPMIASRIAEGMAKHRSVRCIGVERQKKTFAKLQNAVGERPEWTLYRGYVETHLPQILALAGRDPLFSLFDPFGLGIPFDVLTDTVMRRGQAATTEVLLNFSLPGLYRNAGHLLSKSTHPRYLKARPKIISRLNSSLGGDWWQEIWREGKADRNERIFNEFTQRLSKAAGGWSHGSISVSNTWDGPTRYYLLFLTQSNHGLWHFAEAVSLTIEEFRAWTGEQQQNRRQLRLDLGPDEETIWIQKIKDNIEMLLKEGSRIHILHKMLDVYGDTIGWARSKHIRAAIKELHVEGKTPCEGKGDLTKVWIDPPAYV